VFFSIILPSYNGAEVILRAIGSIQRQDFEDYEIAVIDDGSSDDTGKLFAEKETDRLIYRYQKNQGVCAARNAGAAIATGKYLIFLDTDDWLSEHFLIRSYEQLRATGALLQLGYIVFQEAAGNEVKRVLPAKSSSSFSHSLPGAFVIEAETFKRMGGYDVNLSYSENSDLFLRMIQEQWIKPEQVILSDQIGVIKDWVDERERSVKYARKKYDSASYFLEKHTTFFTSSLKDFQNFKRMQMVSALQLNDAAAARQAMRDLLKRDRYSIKTWVQFMAVWLFPQIASKHYS